VLWGVTQECLKRTIFPMGEFHKKDIKQMALDRGYKALAEKSESYEICFIPDNDYRSFLKRRVEGLEEKVKGGHFVSTEGEVVGRHDGYPFYTIGQRKLGVSLGNNPTYVVGIKPETNTVVVGTKEDLKKQEMYVRNINYVKYAEIEDGMECLVKVRYKHKGEMATITNEGKNLRVLFHKKVEGIAPGQSAAIYEGNDLIAGGFIMKNE
jgi:tRNA-specific 2-thiouridylase